MNAKDKKEALRLLPTVIQAIANGAHPVAYNAAARLREIIQFQPVEPEPAPDRDMSISDPPPQPGIITNEEALAMVLARDHGIPFVDLDKLKVDSWIVKKIPERECRKYCMVAFDGKFDDEEKDYLDIAFYNPFDQNARDEIQMFAPTNGVNIFVATKSQITALIDRVYGPPKPADPETTQPES